MIFIYASVGKMNGYRNNYKIQRPNKNRRPDRSRKKLMPVWKIAVIDILLTGIFVVMFAYFHHVNPIREKGIEKQLPIPSNTVMSSVPSQNTDESNEPQDTNEIQKNESVFLASGTPAQASENSYVSENVNIKLTTETAYDSVINIAEIYVRDVKYLKTAFAGGEYNKSWSDKKLVGELAQENNAIFAVNGDQCTARRQSIVVRDGILYRESLFEDVAVLNYDGTLETYSQNEFDINKIKTDGAWQAWNFGPVLLTNGQPMTEFNSKVKVKNPRTAIGMIEPLHYLIITVEGRDKTTVIDGEEFVSKGITMNELSQWFYDKGCVTAYNMDGGETSSMMFNEQTYNSMKSAREVTDIIYIAKD